LKTLFVSFTLLFFIGGLSILGCSNSNETNTTQTNILSSTANTPMQGMYRSRTLFDNPYANIPAQCYIETSYGTQNACMFCHSNAAARKKLGNTLPQAGANNFIGNLQLEYAFGSANAFAKSASINPWENTLFPEKVDAVLNQMNEDVRVWDMKRYIKQDNWQAAYDKKQGAKNVSNSYIANDAFRLFPALNPKALPSDSDGFVRTQESNESLFSDAKGLNTGWRSINFMPYGIFTPHTGSVSGVYIRLKEVFMQNVEGEFDVEVYKVNLELLEKAIQDRLDVNDTHYVGKAAEIYLDKGLFPLGTEFAHPLHYVDVEADANSDTKFAGLRANRVKEVRYMYKYQMHFPGEVVAKDEDAPLYYNAKESWIDNGAGWYMSAFIEDTEGELRAQTSEELLQCVGCHSSTYGFEPEQFTSGTGNTIDTIWSFSRKFEGDAGWSEMDYLKYSHSLHVSKDETVGKAHVGDPINREANVGEFRYFLNHVVGASLYGVMPASMELFLQSKITVSRGYSNDFPSLQMDTPAKLKAIQTLRLKLMREFTANKEYLDEQGYIESSLLFPTQTEALDAAKGYRKIVATQRYTKGKDYFEKSIFSFKYFREESDGFTHIDDTTAYKLGEVITDRPINHKESITKGVGITSTLIDEKGDNYDSEYLPILAYPQEYENR